MTRFSSEVKQEYNTEIITLTDQEHQVGAKIIPEWGNNLVSLMVGKQELIWLPTEIKNLRDEKRQFYGNPILFPFPGRIPGGKFRFQNKDFEVPVNFNDGTAIHGFVYDKRWHVLERSDPSDKETFIKSEYRSNSDIETYFPFIFRLEMTYTLRDNELEICFMAENIGIDAFPFGYGLHPYFQLSGKREDWILNLPASELFELDQLVPTGIRDMVSEKLDFRKGKSFKDIYMDDLFGDLKKDKRGFITCWLNNMKTNFKLMVTSDNNFEYYVVFAPEWGNFICIEPYTCIPNAFNLASQGIVTGLRVLNSNKKFTAKIWLRWEI